MGTPHTSCHPAEADAVTSRTPRDPCPRWGAEPAPSWHLDAACQGMGPEPWFRPDLESLAVRYCKTCAVRAACAEWAVEAGSSLGGVWGALTEADRVRIRRQRRRQPENGV
jgi:hypothetical protein